MTNAKRIAPVTSGRGAPGATVRAVATSLTIALSVAACADKGITPPWRAFNPKVALQLTTIASAQQGLVPNYVWVAAAYAADKDTILLAYKFAPLVTGSQQISLPVDLSPCLAYNATRGKNGCTIVVGASLLQDTSFVADTASRGGDPFSRAFDYTIVGPFEVGPGRTPTIPAIDLSVSRFSVIEWQGDDALRLGGNYTPNSFSGPGAPLAGVFSGTGAPTLFALTSGVQFPATPSNVPLQPYPQLAIFRSGMWQRVTATSAPSNSFFSDVTALSASEAYVAAAGGLYRYDGATISRVTAVNDSLLAVSSVNNANGKLVIAGGPSGVVRIGDTQSWTRYAMPLAQRIDGVCITGPTEAYAASSSNGGLFRFDGSAWTSVSGLSAAGKFELSCPAPGQVFVVDGSSPKKLTAAGWAPVSTTGLPSGRSFRWGVASASEIWAYGDSGSVSRAFYRYDATGVWRSVGQLRYTQPGGRLLADPRGGAAYLASTFGRVEQITATSPSVVSYQPALRDVIVTSPTSAFAVGWNLFLARWDGTMWTVDAPPPNTPTVRILQGVWSDGPKNAWAVGNVSTILHYDGSAWSVVGGVGGPVGTTDNYNAVWGVANDVWIAGENSIVHCSSPSACANESSGGSGILYGLWGSARTNVIAVGAGGRITRYNGTSWSAMNSPTTRNLSRVAGSSASDVWAVGDSVLIHFDGAQWTNFPLSGKGAYLVSHVPSPFQSLFQVGLWVRGPKEVYLGTENGTIARWDGTRWQEMDHQTYRRRVIGISGVGGCALAVTEAQSDVPSPTLWRGVGSSGCFSGPMNAPSAWP